jgi:hypothetical protein
VSDLLRLGSPADAGAFLARVVRVDPAALVRIKPYGDGAIALWAWLNVGALGVRVVSGTGPADAVVAASALLDGLDALGTLGTLGGEVTLPPRRDTEWRGPLPGTGFRRLDELPADVVGRLAVAGEQTFRDAVAAGAGRSRSGARALTDAVLDHVAVVVTGPDGEAADVPQRGVQTLSSLGFLGADPVTVDVTVAWLRLAGTYGAVYLRRGAGLGLSLG